MEKNTDNTKKEELKNNDKMNAVKEFGNTSVIAPNERIQILSIIGQIEGHNVSPPQTKTTKYEHIIPQLVSIEQNDKVEGVLIVLNTVGGDVEAGLAIAEMINSISKPTVSIVIGGGHSIGVPLATSADYSFITPSATMIIHPVRMNGFVIGVAQTFNYFKKMQERINDFIVRTSNISHAAIYLMACYLYALHHHVLHRTSSIEPAEQTHIFVICRKGQPRNGMAATVEGAFV